MNMDKRRDIVVGHYSDYDEEKRLELDRANNLEFLTTMRYIQKYLKPGAKILEVGAATGRYSITLAKMGYDVTAVEITPSYVEIMKRKSRRLKNFRCMVGDALDLSAFGDGSFDIVLCLGPIYHLFNNRDRQRAINESVRVAKRGGVCMFAYIPHSSIMIDYALKYGHVADLWKSCDKRTGALKDSLEEIFSTIYFEEFKKLADKTPTKFIANVATDGLAPRLRHDIAAMSKKEYQAFVEWHFATCERLDQQGFSSHLLYICKKTGK